MKRTFIVLFCVLLTGLYACGATKPNETKTTDTTTTATTVTEEESENPTAEIEETEGAVVTKIEIKTNENDPYSFLVKDYNDHIFPQYFNDIGMYQGGYLTSMAHEYFSLYDLDGDATEELLWCNYYSRSRKDPRWDQYPDTPSIDKIYTIQNGAVVQLDRSTSLGAEIGSHTSLLKNGMIKMMCLLNWEVGDNEDIKNTPSYAYYRFENGELKEMITLIVDDKGRHWRYDAPNSFDRTRITKKKFENLRQEYEGDGQMVELDWRPLTEYGR